MKKKPIVAILGRPNVGKSTLFNRFIKTRKAIIDPTPGVTRDILKGEMELNGLVIELYDTGGLTDEGDALNPYIQENSRRALEASDLILFLVEAGNPLPIEEEYIELVRKLHKPCVIVVNKCDSPEKDIYMTDYYNYGLGEPIPISAAHNRNIDVLEEVIFAKLEHHLPPEEYEEEEEQIDQRIKVAIIGKPNVGKSSLLNTIVGKKRSIVSPLAGTTRDTVDEEFIYKEKEFLLLDTAGIRKKSKVHEDLEYYSVNRAIKTIERSDVTLLVLDAVDELSEQDKKIVDQIVKHGKGLIVLLNKWDLKSNEKGTVEKVKENILFKFPHIQYAPFLPVSALTGKGIEKVLDLAVSIYDQLHIKITTAQLNKFVQDVVKRYAPSSKKGMLKIYYGVQTGCAPVEFIFFLNKKNLITDNYKQYIINRLRQTFHFNGVPIKIIFKTKK